MLGHQSQQVPSPGTPPDHGLAFVLLHLHRACSREQTDRQHWHSGHLIVLLTHSKLISHIRLVLLFFSSSNSSAHFADEEAETQGALAAFLRPCSLGAVKWDSARSPDRLGLWPPFAKGLSPRRAVPRPPP